MIQMVAAAQLAVFGAMKLADPAAATDRPGWYRVALLAVAVAELVLAAWLVLDRVRVGPVVAVAVFGGALLAAGLLLPASLFADGSCGCLGASRIEQGHRLLAGGLLVLLAGARLTLTPESALAAAERGVPTSPSAEARAGPTAQ
jgi:hypothetical protein